MIRKFLMTITLFAGISLTATHVAVLETVSEKDVMGRSEKMFLTDKLRERANAVLPAYLDYIVMTRENIVAMLPPGKTLEDCEGDCVAETGKNISADYVAQARVGMFGSQYTLTMELYETAGSNLIGSFTTRKPNADSLLEEIEKKADDIFKLIAAKTPLVPNEEGNVISNITMGDSREKKVIVTSTPKGAEFTIDEYKDERCNKTPCETALSLGYHRFIFNLDGYATKDTMVNILLPQQSVHAKISKYGTLILQPLFVDNMGSIDSSEIKIDDKIVQGVEHRLPIGTHKVEISHRCYEKTSFTVEIKKSGNIVFDQPLALIMGSLNLKVIDSGIEKKTKIYANGKKIGTAPFENVIVPICATITMGTKKNVVIPVKLIAGETISYTHHSHLGYIDPRDGQSYKAVIIADKIWFGRNLNYKSVDSWCYQNNPAMCEKYGRLYTWENAQTACPVGWHLPSKNEYYQMVKASGQKSRAASALKSKDGWSDYGNKFDYQSGNGFDYWSFSVLPAGGGLYGKPLNNKGKAAYFWTSSKAYSEASDEASAIYMLNDDNAIHVGDFNKNNGFSIRCVKDSQ